MGKENHIITTCNNNCSYCDKVMGSYVPCKNYEETKKPEAIVPKSIIITNRLISFASAFFSSSGLGIHHLR